MQKHQLIIVLTLILAFPVPRLCLADEPATHPVRAERFGLEVQIPADWPVVVREKEDRAFVALIPRDDPDRPAVVACELAIAPESLEDYRTRINGNAARDPLGRRKLTRNEIVKNPQGERLETVWEYQPPVGPSWLERTVRLIHNRQMYAFILNADEKTFSVTEPRFNTLVDTAAFTPPNTGSKRIDEPKNRWLQSEFRFALNLPSDWQPLLAPSEVALFYAAGPPHGIWSDNALVIARPVKALDVHDLAKTVPDTLKQIEPGCEVLRCEVVKQGDRDALETVVRTQRGPFSMTVIE
ncbi:MAG TPA: hypothetical protein VFT74_15650, partial [Isosphaeraceae bacterium]|nr:hypothetical protein [Isosphaeraceae bacterium]